MRDNPARAHARWLAQLASVLGEARVLIASQEFSSRYPLLGPELEARVATAQIEAEKLQRKHERRSRRYIDPNWINRRRGVGL